jgi:O-antigen/teichoic acid export membrane protein
MAHHVVKDAVWQIVGRVVSAVGGFLVLKLITPYLGPLRFGDYSTILKYFAIWSALADFGMYVIALKKLGSIPAEQHEERSALYSKFVSTRMLLIGVIYISAYLLTFLIPAYTSNPYLLRGLPLGMIFSASFMAAWIIQIPLQLYRKMHQLSIGLTVARVAQLLVLVIAILFVYPHVSFATPGENILPFVWIIASVVISGVAQGIYVFRQGNKHLPLKRNLDFSFTKHIIWENRQYGIAYYCSSFHTLIVLLLFSRFFPTTEWFTLVGKWALGLSLLEILLIVPSALWNSLIHKVAWNSVEEQRRSFGNLLMTIIWIGCIICINFTLFAPHIINFLWGSAFLSTATYWWSDSLLPWLAVILTLSFVKQIFNYLFVSTHLQNKLLQINLVGVLIGVSIGIPLILQYELMGGLLTQGLLEILFVAWALWTAKKHAVLPYIDGKLVILWLFVTWLICLGGYGLLHTRQVDGLAWILVSLLLTSLLTLLSKPQLARLLKGL